MKRNRLAIIWLLLFFVVSSFLPSINVCANPEEKVESISISQFPKLFYTEGESLDLSGLEVTATYSGGSTALLNPADYTTNPTNGEVLNIVGEYEVVVTYIGSSDIRISFAISVKPSGHRIVIEKIFNPTFDERLVSVIESIPVEDGKLLTRPVVPDLSDYGYVLDNWYIDQGLTTPYNFGAPVTNSFKLYAYFVKGYQVKFNTNGGSSVAVENVQDGKTLTKPANPTRSGYAFVNWYTNADLTVLYDFSAPVSENLTLYAKWSLNDSAPTLPIYTVAFDTNGGSSVAEVTVQDGKTLTKPANPTRSGYAFVNWYTNADLTVLYDFSAPVSKNLTLYAKWSLNDSESTNLETPEPQTSPEIVIILTIGKDTYTVGGKTKTMDVAPFIEGDRTYVPVRFIAESLGATVGWDNETRTVTITLGSKTLALVIDKEILGADVIPFIRDSRTFVPLRYISEHLGAAIDWDDSTRTISITK